MYEAGTARERRRCAWKPGGRDVTKQGPGTQSKEWWDEEAASVNLLIEHRRQDCERQG